MTIRLMSRTEIAEYLGVGLATVKQYKHMPEPDVVIGRNQGWSRETIDAAIEAGKIPPRKGVA
jgi:predicted transcriptional regulator